MSASVSASAPDLAVAITALSKVYRGRDGRGIANNLQPPALDGVDLQIPRGSIFGLLGPNGAGKSTLINILAGLVIKSAGTVHIWGIDIDRDPRNARCAIGVVPQELNIDPFFTPRELLNLHAGLYGVPGAERQTEALLAAVGLADKADAYARTLSGGMRRRLMVAKAMVHSPPVLVLDEPTAGVDVELRRQLWNHVRILNAAGTTILLTTHYLEEAEELCDRIAIIDHGRLVACDTTAALRGQFDRKVLRLTVDRDVAQPPAGLAALGAEVRIHDSRHLVVSYPPSRIGVEALLGAVREAGLALVDLSTQEVRLEEVFLALTAGTHAARRPATDGPAGERRT